MKRVWYPVCTKKVEQKGEVVFIVKMEPKLNMSKEREVTSKWRGPFRAPHGSVLGTLKKGGNPFQQWIWEKWSGDKGKTKRLINSSTRKRVRDMQE